MPTRPTGAGSNLAKIVEKQMRNWELACAQQIKPPDTTERPEVADFVAISRSVASGGTQVATLLGERLQWPVFDRGILQAMAGDDHLRGRLYENMDERKVSWLEETLRWLMGGERPKDDYFYRLTEAVLALSCQGHAVFLGRAVDLILPPERGLRVRIDMSLERRVETFSKRHDVSMALATAEIERIDHDRSEFRRRHFGKAADDSTRYDLTLVLDRFTPAQAADLILAALRVRGVLS